MTENELRQEFESLMERAEDRWRSSFSSYDLEPYLLAILEFLKRNLESQDILERFFVELLDSSKWRVSLEVIEFCMHELRWPKVKMRVEEIIAQTENVAPRDSTWKIAEAYSDDWDGGEFYKYYS